MSPLPKILIVDDLPEKRLVYQSILEDLDEPGRPASGAVELVMARSASEALKHLLHDDFAVILLDVNMPEMDGFEAASMIRSRRRCAHTPIIFITAYVDDLHVVKGYSYGAVDYILSPVNPDVLRTKVRVFVDLFRKTLEVQEQAKQLRDVQDREHQRQLWESNQRLNLALESGQMGTCEWDLSERLLSWSPTLETIFGFAPGEFDGSTEQLQARLHPDDGDRVIPIMIEAVRLRTEFCIEHRIVRPNGEVAWVELRGKVFADAECDASKPLRVAGVCIDITLRKRTESELARHREQLEDLVRERTAELETSYERLQLADRLASIGTLAAGLGHDMGNLLLPVRARLDSLEHRLQNIFSPNDISLQTPANSAPATQSLDDIGAIRTACDYLNRLSQGLRLFALDPEKQGSGEQTDLATWWRDVESFLRNALPRPIKLEFILPDDIAPMAIAPHAFTQVIYNLVQNAGDAMRERGTGRVVITAASATSNHSSESDVSEVPPPVLITVADDGPGMSEQVRLRCMEPFFTTKTRQISTGLGLALVRGAVYNAGGSIEVESTLGRGTTFKLHVPVANAATSAVSVSRRLACVNLRDGRIRAYVMSLLKSYGLEVSSETWSPDQPAHVLVLEDPNGLWCDVEAFLRRDAARRAVVFDPPALICPRLNGQIATIQGKPAPAEIRRVLQLSLES